MKKITLLAPLVLLIALPVLVHAASTFVPLAPIPGLTDVGTNNLAAFFNGLYKFCIGAAVVLAILEITMGGFMVMSGDSITAHSEGRDKIVGAILGLVLVLSPFLVFSIINPQILTLKIGNLDSLQPSSTNTGTPGTENGNAGNSTTGDGTTSATGTSTTAPSNLKSTTQTDTSVTLSWTAPTGTAPAAYDVYNGSTLAQSVTGTTATISGLTTATPYSFTVKARSANGDVSAPSNEVQTNTLEVVTTTAAAGSLGSYTWSDWKYQGNIAIANGDPVPTFQNCWVFNSVPFENPSYDSATGKAIDVQKLCAQRLQDAQNGDKTPTGGKATHYYQCVLVGPGKTVTKPAAPGPVCSSSMTSPQ